MSLLQVEGLTKSYTGLTAVDSVDISVEDREFLGIIGPNGAGKTTLFSLLAGSQPPTSGRIVSTSSTSPAGRRRRWRAADWCARSS
jgi:branched-chain amino acid transport system ATP-binding protein